MIKTFFYWIHNIYVDSIWGQTIVDLANIYALIHKLERNDNATEDDVAFVLSEFCAKVKEIFDRKTKSNCCVSIKVPQSNYSESGQWISMQVKNIARDQQHLTERDTPEYNKMEHNIIGNTAYSTIVSLVLNSKKKKFYLKNNVQEDESYLSTSPYIYYKSELVVPIIPTDYDNINDIEFLGFLCIDSDRKNSFDKDRYDISMTRGIADSLYSLINKLITNGLLKTT